MAGDQTRFLWSDAWLLESIVLASGSADGSLAEIIAAADGINHAILSDDEIHGGLVRLTAAGFVEEIDGCFRPTARVPRPFRGRDGVRAFLGADPWTSETASKQPENQGVFYPGITTETIA